MRAAGIGGIAGSSQHTTAAEPGVGAHQQRPLARRCAIALGLGYLLFAAQALLFSGPLFIAGSPHFYRSPRRPSDRPAAVRREHLRESATKTTCWWKGIASYYDPPATPRGGPDRVMCLRGLPALPCARRA